MYKRVLLVAAVASVAFVAFTLRWLYTDGPLRNPQEALADFHAGTARAEDMLMDPLILNGRPVVRLVIKAVTEKEMEKRRYAICFLGNGGYSEAMPLLEKIVGDPSEIYYFRADALEALAAISPDRGREVAKTHTTDENLFGDVAREIVAGKPKGYCRRSWWEAFSGHHG
jgi:hypothetical protein